MEKPSRRFWLLTIVAIVGLAVLQQVWHWEVERIEVPPGEFLVRIHRWGQDLPEDEIVAKDASYKGVMLDVLGEGRHFLNPIFWTYEFHKIKEVPATSFGCCHNSNCPLGHTDAGHGDFDMT